MNELLTIVRSSDRSDDDLGLLNFLHRVRFYRQNGTQSCGVCGMKEPMPDATPLLADWPSTMKCGHAFTDLMWTPNPGVIR